MGWGFQPGEELRPAFRRVAEEEIARIRASLTSETNREKAIHEARQGFKRLRALVRLAKPAIGSAFHDESMRWRDAGQLLAGTRDRTVRLQSYDRLTTALSDALPSEAVTEIRCRIANDLHPVSSAEEHVGEVMAMLDAAERSARLLRWPNNKDSLLKGLEHSQTRLSRDWEKAHDGCVPHVLHRWRKRVKDQAAQLRLFRRVMPHAFRATRNDEKEVAEQLGEEHDLWLLAERLSLESFAPPVDAVRDRLLHAIAARRSELRGVAFARAEKFSSVKPKRFARSLGDAWEKAARTETKPVQKKSRREVVNRRAISQAS